MAIFLTLNTLILLLFLIIVPRFVPRQLMSRLLPIGREFSATLRKPSLPLSYFMIWASSMIVRSSSSFDFFRTSSLEFRVSSTLQTQPKDPSPIFSNISMLFDKLENCSVSSKARWQQWCLGFFIISFSVFDAIQKLIDSVAMIIFRSLYPVSFRKSGIINAPSSAVYAVISQTDRYHKFIPWCNRATILERTSPSHNKTELCVSFQKFHELRYVSDVHLTEAKSQQDCSSVHSVCRQKPLKELDSLWEIRAVEKNKSLVHYTLTFEFESPLYQLASSMMISYLGKQMWSLFEQQSIRNHQAALVENGMDTRDESGLQKQAGRDAQLQKASNSLDQFLEKHKEIKKLYVQDRKLEGHLKRLDGVLSGSLDYDQKMLFQARNWLTHGR